MRRDPEVAIALRLCQQAVALPFTGAGSARVGAPGRCLPEPSSTAGTPWRVTRWRRHRHRKLAAPTTGPPTGSPACRGTTSPPLSGRPPGGDAGEPLPAQRRGASTCGRRGAPASVSSVFGSVAHGDFNLWSDIDDVVVAARHLPDRLVDRLEAVGSRPACSRCPGRPTSGGCRLRAATRSSSRRRSAGCGSSARRRTLPEGRGESNVALSSVAAIHARRGRRWWSGAGSNRRPDDFQLTRSQRCAHQAKRRSSTSETAKVMR